MANPNWQNRTLFHGDNLAFLRAMNSESVDLIATDPPFNKGRDFHATPDSLAAGAKFQDRWSWEDDVQEEWIDQITDDYPRLMEAIKSARYAHSDGMGAFMCFMAVRLLEMRRLLKPTGSIYLHCDPTASHYLKATMDAVFGQSNFLNDIVWRRAISHNDSGRFGNITDNILFYGKSKARYWDGYAIAASKTREQLALPIRPATSGVGIGATTSRGRCTPPRRDRQARSHGVGTTYTRWADAGACRRRETIRDTSTIT